MLGFVLGVIAVFLVFGYFGLPILVVDRRRGPAHLVPQRRRRSSGS